MDKVNKNDEAISFETEDYLGNKVDLNSYRGRKVFLGFYRGTACPFCLGRIKKLIKRYEQLKAKEIDIIVFIPAEKETILKTSKNTLAPFPIIADPGQEIFEKYGIADSKFVIMKAMLKPFRMMKIMLSNPFSLKLFVEASKLPVEILLAEDLKMERVHYGTSLGDYLPLQDIIK